MTETKVTAAAIASALVPLIMLAASLFGWDVTEEGAYQTVTAVAVVAIPLVTFIAGRLRRSPTSAVSTGFNPTVASNALNDQGLTAAAERLAGIPGQPS